MTRTCFICLSLSHSEMFLLLVGQKYKCVSDVNTSV